MLKPDRFSCSQKFQLKWDPPVVKDFNEKCNVYLSELFQNVDIHNWEITEPLIAEYNLRVRNLLVEIQTDYGFRLCCHDMEYDDVAVWTDLFKISVIRCLTPLVQQANHNTSPNPNFHAHPCPNNSYLDRSSTLDRGTGRDTQVRGGGQPVE